MSSWSSTQAKYWKTTLAARFAIPPCAWKDSRFMSAAKNEEEEQEGFSVWTPLLLLLLARWSANLKDEGNLKAALSMLVMVLARALPPSAGTQPATL